MIFLALLMAPPTKAINVSILFTVLLVIIMSANESLLHFL